MRKHSSKIIASLFALSLVAIAVFYLPRLFTSSPSEEEEWVTVMPGHWWKVQLDEEQFEILESLWQNDVPTKQWLEQVCPEVIQDLPAEALDAWEDCEVFWPPVTFEEWKSYPHMYYSKGTPYDGGITQFEIFGGSSEFETNTFNHEPRLQFVEERCYRISVYTDDVLSEEMD